MNVVTLIGALTRDPEMRGSGEARVCAMRLVESGAPGSPPLYIDVAAFGRVAEACGRHLTKGRRVAITGPLRFREWKGAGGERRSGHSIAAQQVDFLPAGARPEPDPPAEPPGE